MACSKDYAHYGRGAAETIFRRTSATRAESNRVTRFLARLDSPERHFHKSRSVRDPRALAACSRASE
jgi:hypothetical protein